MKTLTAKDIQNELGISLSTAYRLIKDIKKEYNVKSNFITMNHLVDYIGLGSCSNRN